MSSVQSYKHSIYARCCPGQVGRWNLIVACGMLKPVYFAFETILEFFLQTTHFVKLRAHSPGPTSKIIVMMIALRRAILMKADPVVSLNAHRLFSGRACSCKIDPCFKRGIFTDKFRVAHIRYIKILTWPRGFLVLFCFCLVFFVFKSLLGIARQRSRETFAFLTLKP